MESSSTLNVILFDGNIVIMTGILHLLDMIARARLAIRIKSFFFASKHLIVVFSSSQPCKMIRK